MHTVLISQLNTAPHRKLSKNWFSSANNLYNKMAYQPWHRVHKYVEVSFQHFFTDNAVSRCSNPIKITKKQIISGTNGLLLVY